MSISDEVRASAAAHRDLGPGYETAVAEGLVERIGEEIDRRVDARLYGQASYQNPPPPPRLRPEPLPRRLALRTAVLALGSVTLARRGLAGLPALPAFPAFPGLAGWLLGFRGPRRRPAPSQGPPGRPAPCHLMPYRPPCLGRLTLCPPPSRGFPGSLLRRPGTRD